MSKFVIDIDGVIATEVKDTVSIDNLGLVSINYSLATPIEENISFFNSLYEDGHTVVYFTARGSDTGVDWRLCTEVQLKTWGVKYHELRLGKPSADYYVDDKLASIESLKYIYRKEYNYGE